MPVVPPEECEFASRFLLGGTAGRDWRPVVMPATSVMGMGWLIWIGWHREGNSCSRRKLWKLCGGRRGSVLG